MTNEQLKELEDKLWDSANSLRAYGGIKAADYAVPVLGLIFLKFADNKYSLAEPQILETYKKDKGTRIERPIEEIALATCGFYLPDTSRFDYLLHLPKEEKMSKALHKAMADIEKYQDVKFQDVLPKEAYYDIEKKKDDILPALLKTFSDIPKDASGDLFGKIYEYFLGKFALSEGQKGGEFFTPTSVVHFIVEVIEPYIGKLFDPACGSGGMFVQSGSFLRKANHDLNDIYVYGQEFMGETVRLAKMNLLVNNLRGEIAEVNSYEEDPFDSYGKFDFVMANPPFNVKSVKEGTVKNDQRFYQYGLPKNKGKKDDKISDANYLWISLFATSLNENGRAGFVMANSASDARNAEYEIRKKIVDRGIVDCMVSMPSNMFFTVTLPATLWFLDKQKARTDRKDKILFLDARNVYRQIDRAHREWTEEQTQNLAAVVRLYRGETERYLELINTYLVEAETSVRSVAPAREALQNQLIRVAEGLRDYAETVMDELPSAKHKKLEEADFFNQLDDFGWPKVGTQDLGEALKQVPLHNDHQLKAAHHLVPFLEKESQNVEILKTATTKLVELWKLADKDLKLKSDKSWADLDLNKADKPLEKILQSYLQAKDEVAYWYDNIQWLQKRFPEAQYQDVVGLCKVANRGEYVEEQDYSLNAGRYVGVEMEDDSTSHEEFKVKILSKATLLAELEEQAHLLEKSIHAKIKELLV